MPVDGCGSKVIERNHSLKCTSWSIHHAKDLQSERSFRSPFSAQTRVRFRRLPTRQRCEVYIRLRKPLQAPRRLSGFSRPCFDQCLRLRGGWARQPGALLGQPQKQAYKQIEEVLAYMISRREQASPLFSVFNRRVFEKTKTGRLEPKSGTIMHRNSIPRLIVLGCFN